MIQTGTERQRDMQCDREITRHRELSDVVSPFPLRLPEGRVHMGYLKENI